MLLIWVALMQGVLGGAVLPSPSPDEARSVTSAVFEIRPDRSADVRRDIAALPMQLLGPMDPSSSFLLAQEGSSVPNSDSLNGSAENRVPIPLAIAGIIAAIVGTAAFVTWRYRLASEESGDIPSGPIAVSVERRGDRRVRVSDKLRVGFEAIAFVALLPQQRGIARRSLANAEGDITRESIAAAASSHVEAAIAAEFRSRSIEEICDSNLDACKQAIKKRLGEPLQSVGLDLVNVEFVDIEGQNPYDDEYAVPVNLLDGNAVQTRDNLQANVKAVFFVRFEKPQSDGNNSGISGSISSVLLDEGAVSKQRVEGAVRLRAEPALRAAASEFDLGEIGYGKSLPASGARRGRSDGNGYSFDLAVKERFDLSGIGLHLVDIVISDVDGIDIYGTEYAVEIELAGSAALRVRNYLRADIRAAFLVTIDEKEKEAACRALSEGAAISPRRIREVVRARALAALRAKGTGHELSYIHAHRAEFAREVESGTDLSDVGLTLKQVIITEVEENDYYLDNENDYFDAQGITNRAEAIDRQRLEKRKQELKAERDLEQAELESQQQARATAQEREQLAFELEVRRLERQAQLKLKEDEQKAIAEEVESNAAIRATELEIARLQREAERVREEEKIGTVIEEARQEREAILLAIAESEAKRIEALAKADAVGKKAVSELDRMAMIVTTLAPQIMEHLPEIAEVAKAMSLQPGALTNTRIYNVTDGDSKSNGASGVIGGLSSILPLIIDKLDPDKPQNGLTANETRVNSDSDPSTFEDTASE